MLERKDVLIPDDFVLDYNLSEKEQERQWKKRCAEVTEAFEKLGLGTNK